MSDLRKAIERLKTPMRYHDHEVTYHSAINDVLALPELKSAIEKASKYDKLFSNLQAVERLKPTLVYSVTSTGTFTPAKAEQDIYRPLTEAEKEEAMEIIMSYLVEPDIHGNVIKPKLKSGIRIEAKK